MHKFNIDETKNTIRVKMESLDDSQENSFRIIPIGRDTGIRVEAVKRKANGSMQIQTYVFDKAKWTQIKAEAWVNDHAEKFEIISFSKEEKK